MKKILVYCVTATTLLCACHITSRKKDDNSSQQLISSMTYQANNGWAYRILLDKKIFIQQEFIPAVSGNNPFPTKESAENVAALVIKKMKQHERPFVTEEELVKTGALQ